MKKHTLIGLITTLGSLSAFGQVVVPEADYHCKDLYLPRVQKLEKSSHRRVLGKKILKSSVVLGTAIPGIAIAAATGGVSLVAGGVITTFIGAPSASMGIIDWVDGTKDTKLDGLVEAMSMQELMYTSEADFMSLLKEESQKQLKKSLEDFDNRITHPQVVAELVTKRNEQR